MDLRKAFKTDENKELEGVWVSLAEDARIKVARAGNPRYQARMAELTRPYRAAIKNNTLSQDVLRDLTIRVMAETILLDWEGIQEDGQDVPYSVEKAKEYLQLKDFREFVAQCSLDQSLFKQQEFEETEKNFVNG